MIGCVFGWRRADGTRRFRIAHVEVVRKNGKTTLASGVGLLLFLLDGEPGAEVYTCATKKDQAKLTHEESKRMVKASPGLARRVSVNKDNLSVEATNSKYEPLAAEGGKLDGLNVHGAVLDELHAWQQRLLWDVLETAPGAREQPLFFVTTRAGCDQNSIWWERREHCRRVLEVTEDDDGLFAHIATLDAGDDCPTAGRTPRRPRRISLEATTRPLPHDRVRLFAVRPPVRSAPSAAKGPFFLADCGATRYAGAHFQRCHRGTALMSTRPDDQRSSSSAPGGRRRRDPLRPDSHRGPLGHALLRRPPRHALLRRRRPAAPSAAVRPRLRDPGRAGPRRHGRRLPGPAARLQPHRRPQDDPGGAHAGPDELRPLPHRGGGRRAAAAPQHRAGPRGRRARRPAVLLAWSSAPAAAWTTSSAARRCRRRRRRRLVETLARAVQAAHEQDVVHRDLKPANVLLAADGTPKVTDFGLAKKLDEAGQTQTGAVMGTPSYMAPEQAGGRTKEIGPATDVYALGAILYECLTGRPPFRGRPTLDTLMQVLSDEPVPPRRLQPKRRATWRRSV